ncbi:DUF4097 family beta strand repeat-containing protein [Alteromonas halophila]|uniref:Adhesin domain-containing protein n=1 Tax=Alteromonas halophila TaxID=516698 RepID=A0A918JMJ2_9ALTE|nr:DUF4097 family beta strand repeat-containing protein [Alteromonas halophila]GGW83641.1 hypothetical protein GCM10007391_16520 [Alteromonas halophila]
MKTVFAFRKGAGLAWLAGVSMTLLSQVALSGERIDRSIDTSDAPYVDIEHMNGKAEIIGWDKNSVKVVGEVGENTDEVSFEKSGNEVELKIEVARSGRDWRNWRSNEGDDLTIHVPHGSRVHYSSINANVALRNLKNSVSVEVVNGDIESRNIQGRVELEAVNGDIDVGEISGDVTIETVNGDIFGDHQSDKDARFSSVNGNINIRSSSPELWVESVNGNIKLAMQAVDDLNIETVNGRVEAELSLNRNGDVRASSVGGSITLNFQPDVSAQFDIEAHAGGRIINKISEDEMQKAKYGPRRWLEFIHNGGQARVDVSTVSGRITLDN